MQYCAQIDHHSHQNAVCESVSALPIMISDNDLYSLAIFLGSLAMLLVVLYHFLEVNAVDNAGEKARLPLAATLDKEAAKPASQGSTKKAAR